jgi:hypothetical protein
MIVHSICFVQTWNTGLAERYVAPILSHHNTAALDYDTPNSSSKVCTHITSAIALANDLYSASVLDLKPWLAF